MILLYFRFNYHIYPTFGTLSNLFLMQNGTLVNTLKWCKWNFVTLKIRVLEWNEFRPPLIQNYGNLLTFWILNWHILLIFFNWGLTWSTVYSLVAILKKYGSTTTICSLIIYIYIYTHQLECTNYVNSHLGQQ